VLDPITRSQLLARGMTVRGIAAAVHHGDLIRTRRDRYLPPSAPPDLIAATRVGGRLACLSELRARGVWVAGDDGVHVHLAPNASRLRDPRDRRRRFVPQPGVRLHWTDLVDDHHGSPGHVSVVDALLQASRCQPRRLFQASLDSAARAGLLRGRARLLLARDHVVGPLLRRVDSAAGSGLETIVRELARDLGFTVRTQVPIDGAGFVDLVVEDWIVVECDGLDFHTGAAVSRDRRRDAAVVATGRTALRFVYAQVVYDLPSVARSLIAAVAMHRGVRNSGRKARRALVRAGSGGLA
jgi:very-short-patch-repair endonuclease